MDRYSRIRSATFDSIVLPLPLSARVGRHAEAAVKNGDGGPFAGSVEFTGEQVRAEIEIRGVAVAETLTLGRQGDLSLVIDGAASGQAARTITLAGAVLLGIEHVYGRQTFASARLTFIAQSDTDTIDPFAAEDPS